MEPTYYWLNSVDRAVRLGPFSFERARGGTQYITPVASVIAKPQWKCPYCGSLRHDEAMQCPGCGYMRED
jgi:rubrerythrin